MAEAEALGSGFVRTGGDPTALWADVLLLATRRQDLETFEARGFPVTAASFDRLERLNALLCEARTEKEFLETDREERADRDEAIRKDLLDLRERLARYGAAGDLPASMFSLQTKSTARVNMVVGGMQTVLRNVSNLRERLARDPRVDELVREATALLAEHAAGRERDSADEARFYEVSLRAAQLMRLLLDAAQHLCRQGAAAFQGQPNFYRLTKFYLRRKKREAAAPVTS